MAALDDSEINLDFVDGSGMTCLHHAARLCLVDLTTAFVERKPQLVDALTFVHKTPSKWTALQCLADQAKGKTDEEQEVNHLCTHAHLRRGAARGAGWTEHEDEGLWPCGGGARR